MKKRWPLLLALPLSLALTACPEEKAAETKPEKSLTVPTPTPTPAVDGPSEAAKARAEALRGQKPQTTTEVRAGWAMAACAAGCDERQEAIATRLSAAAQLVPFTRDEVPVGLQLVQLRAYSPWISCRLEPGDRITAVEKVQVRTVEDIPRVIRACTLGQALTVERRGKSLEIPVRGQAAATGAKGPKGAAGAKEVVPEGTRDLE